MKVMHKMQHHRSAASHRMDDNDEMDVDDLPKQNASQETTVIRPKPSKWHRPLIKKMADIVESEDCRISPKERTPFIQEGVAAPRGEVSS